MLKVEHFQIFVKETPFQPEPYQCTKEVRKEGVAYYFETDKKVRYEACFFDYMYMFETVELDCQICEFSLIVANANDVRPPRGTPKDERIEATIQGLFKDFFESVDNVAVTIYDSSDGMEEARFKKFDEWFENGKANDQTTKIEKYDFTYTEDDYKFLSSLFVHQDFRNKEKLLQSYQEIVEGGNMPLS